METARFYLIEQSGAILTNSLKHGSGRVCHRRVASTLYVIGSAQDSGTLSILDLDKHVAGDDGERGDFL